MKAVKEAKAPPLEEAKVEEAEEAIIGAGLPAIEEDEAALELHKKAELEIAGKLLEAVPQS